MSLLSLLPSPKQHFASPSESYQPILHQPSGQSNLRQPPPYGQRQGFIPRDSEDFGDGGAFPEIHVAQYPLDMGRKNKAPSSQIVPLTLDAQGEVRYDALVTQGTKQNVFSQGTDLMPKQFEDETLERPDEEKIKETTDKTLEALSKIVNGKIAAAQPSRTSQQQGAPTYIRYTPAQQGDGYNSGAKQRVIRMVEMPKDPLEPSKFKHKRVPRGPPSPPVPVMHSPPRKVTMRDQQDWKIPPCISNWKNPKGYTIPLDKRLAADGRGLQEVQINDNFAKLSQSLYTAERNARAEVEKRAQIRKILAMKEKETKEQLLRQLAMEARQPKSQPDTETRLGEDELAEKVQRDELREERRKERERQRRMEAAGKKTKLSRDEDRDISELVALGNKAPAKSTESMYDQRLFNQSEGLDSGYGHDDSYNVYDKALFSGSSANTIYRPKKGDTDIYGGEEDMKKILNTDRFKPDKAFSGAEGTERTEPRSRPVEYEKDEEEDDPFGLEEFLNEAKKGKTTTTPARSSSSSSHSSASSSGTKRKHEEGDSTRSSSSKRR